MGTNTFLADALWSEFPGTSDLTRRGPPPPGSRRAGGQFPGWPRGQRQKTSVDPDSFLEACAHPRLHVSPGGGPARHHLPLAETPAPSSPRPAPWKLRSRDPRSNGAAGNWPLDFLRPDSDWGRPVGGAGKPGLPHSCFRPGASLS